MPNVGIAHFKIRSYVSRIYCDFILLQLDGNSQP